MINTFIHSTSSLGNHTRSWADQNSQSLYPSSDQNATKTYPLGRLHIPEHFLSHSNHSHTDMQLIPLEKIHSSRDSVRKAREPHLIDKAMTLEPHGLNRRDELL